MSELLRVPVLVLACVMLTSVLAQGEIIEDFEDGNMVEYSIVGTVNATVNTAAAHDGNYGLDFAGHSSTEGWVYRDDAQVHLQQGDTFTLWARHTTAGTRTYCGFGATAGGCYSVILSENTGELVIQYNANYGYLTLAASPQSWGVQWYFIEVMWDVGGGITANLYDSDGTSFLNTVSTVHNAITSGGIAFRSWDSGHSAYLDTVSRAGGSTAVESATWGAIKTLFE